MNLKFLLLTSIFLIGVSYSISSKKLRITSPDKKIELNVLMVNDQLSYEINWSGKKMIDLSELSIFSGNKIKILNSKINEQDNKWETVWGQFSKIRNNYRELEVDIISNKVKGKLLARVFNNGIGFRFILEEGKKNSKTNFFCEYNLSPNCYLYAHLDENEPLGPINFTNLCKKTETTSKEKHTQLSPPLVVENSSGTFMAILESDLYSTTGFQAMKFCVNTKKNNVFSNSEVKLTNDQLITPWRVILFGKSAGELVVNTTPINLAAPCKIKDTDWIKPGLTLWDWRVHGYTAEDGFTYGINTASYKRFIDFAADNDINYFLIDDAWYKKVSKGYFELSDKLDLESIRDYAKDKAVDLMLYYDRRHGQYGDNELFKYYSSLNMKGIKYGFMGEKVPFTKNAIGLSAKSKLLIDFHDRPVPYTGVRRTMPNAITREYCHAQQDSRKVFTPETFLKMALINAITGPLDMNNGNFDITGINSGKRKKGPRKSNTYITTVTSEAARILIIFSGLVCLPDAPEAYAAKKDLFEFIKNQPVGKWDESRILNSKIGEYITTARRKEKEWFIGSVISQKGGQLSINLDFLEKGLIYQATLYEDTDKTHCITNPESYQVRKIKVKRGDIINAKLAPGGGHCIWIKPE